MNNKNYNNDYMARFLLLCYTLKEQDKFVKQNPKYEELCQNVNTERISQEIIEEYAPTVIKYLNLCEMLENVECAPFKRNINWDQIFDLVEYIIKDQIDI